MLGLLLLLLPLLLDLADGLGDVLLGKLFDLRNFLI